VTPWPDLDAYKAWARLAPDDTTDDVAITAALNGATAAVLARCRSLVEPGTGLPVEDCPPDVVEAVLMWTNRLFNRRNSPTGVVGVADTGQIVVPGRDADIARLLAPWRTVVAG